MSDQPPRSQPPRPTWTAHVRHSQDLLGPLGPSPALLDRVAQYMMDSTPREDEPVTPEGTPAHDAFMLMQALKQNCGTSFAYILTMAETLRSADGALDILSAAVIIMAFGYRVRATEEMERMARLG